MWPITVQRFHPYESVKITRNLMEEDIATIEKRTWENNGRSATRYKATERRTDAVKWAEKIEYEYPHKRRPKTATHSSLVFGL